MHTKIKWIYAQTAMNHRVELRTLKNERIQNKMKKGI